MKDMRLNPMLSFTGLIRAFAVSFAAITLSAAPVHLVEEAPVSVTTVAPGVVLVDFGRVAFGNLRLTPPPEGGGKITVQFGEAFAGGRINRKPPGCVRYAAVEVALDKVPSLIVAPLADARNTRQPAAVLTPLEWGVVLPFRWVEIEGWPGGLHPAQMRRRAAFAATWDDNAAAFSSSDPVLDRVWELCRYTLKATTFAGVYVDGDRERISYEADAYLQQIGQYYTDNNVQMARDTYDRLMARPTWPSEWAPHMIFMAHADWMKTGDVRWLAPRYEALKKKLQLDRARPDGLLSSADQKVRGNDLVDWPTGERDGYVFTEANTVVNAFHLCALALMAELARALGKNEDAASYSAREQNLRAVFEKTFFDSAQGLYRDGEGTDHTSLHANLFPLAFGLVPSEHRASIARWLAGRGMRCSVYAAQYLLQGLFENRQADAALQLMLAGNDRSWKHMLDSGTTLTWEAWDQRYKPNQDWNHAWGAAPANLLPRYILGARPLAPGWTCAEIAPQPGTLSRAEGKVPTPLGPILIRWENKAAFKLSVTVPPGMKARVCLPVTVQARNVLLNGRPVSTSRTDQGWFLDADVVGTAVIETR